MLHSTPSRAGTLWFIAAGLMLCLNISASGQTSFDEREHKLLVPLHLVEELWLYLHEQYGGDEPLHETFELPVTLDAFFNDEYFIDQYFDTPDLRLLHAQGGVRYRQRFVPDQPDDDRHGRRRLQVKLDQPETSALIRTEVTFRNLRSNGAVRDLDDVHPVLSLIRRSERDTFREVMMQVGVDAADLQPTIRLDQHRRRLYLTRSGVLWGQVSLDVVECTQWWRTVRFALVEIANDEGTYTNATPEKQAAIAHLQDAIKADLLASFPELHVDLTPKYTMAYNLLEKQFISFPVALRYGWPIEVVIAAAATFVLAGLLVATRRLILRTRNAAHAAV